MVMEMTLPSFSIYKLTVLEVQVLLATMEIRKSRCGLLGYYFDCHVHNGWWYLHCTFQSQEFQVSTGS